MDEKKSKYTESNMKELIKKIILESISYKEEFLNSDHSTFIEMISGITTALKTGKKLLICGNGGSAADSQHIATEFVVRLSSKSTAPPLPAIALTTDSSTLTAAANDFGFKKIFSRQIEALGNSGDFLLLISTSGDSENLLAAAEVAEKMNIKTGAFLGKTGGKLKNLVTYPVLVEGENGTRIQEVHILLGHILCELVQKSFQK